MDKIVNHPAHYNLGTVECIDAIEAAICEQVDPVEAFLTGQVIKYMWRWPAKNGAEDLRKARWYLDRLIERYDGQKEDGEMLRRTFDHAFSERAARDAAMEQKEAERLFREPREPVNVPTIRFQMEKRDKSEIQRTDDLQRAAQRVEASVEGTKEEDDKTDRFNQGIENIMSYQPRARKDGEA